MKKLEIHHVLNGETVVTALAVSDGEARRAIDRFPHLRANDGTLNGPNFAIPARSIELIRVVDE